MQLAEVGLNNPCECEQLYGDRCGPLGWARQGEPAAEALGHERPTGGGNDRLLSIRLLINSPHSC